MQLNNHEKHIALYGAFFEIETAKLNPAALKAFDDFLNKIKPNSFNDDPTLEFAINLLRLQRNLQNSVEPFLTFLETKNFKEEKTKYVFLLKEKLIDILLNNKVFYEKGANHQAYSHFSQKWYSLESDSIIRTRILKFIMEKMEDYAMSLDLLKMIEDNYKKKNSDPEQMMSGELAEESAQNFNNLLQYYPLFSKEEQLKFKSKAMPLAEKITKDLSLNLEDEKADEKLERKELLKELERFINQDGQRITPQNNLLTELDEDKGLYRLTVDTQKYDIGLAVANDWNSPQTPTDFKKQWGGIAALNGGFWNQRSQSELQSNEFKFADTSLNPEEPLTEPSALVKSKGVLWHDSSSPWGAAAWKGGDAGKVIFGELSTEWLARDFYGNDLVLKRGVYHPSYEKTHIFLPADQESFEGKLNNLHLVIDHRVVVNFEYANENAILVNKKENIFAFDFNKNTQYREFTPRKGVEIKILCKLNQESISNIEGRYVDDPALSAEAAKALPPTYDSQTWQDKDFIISGRPILLENGRIRKDIKEQDPTADSLARNNRTSFCVRKDGTWNLLVSTKFNLYELTNYLKELGCWNALMLDGGASSTIELKDQILTQKIHGHLLNSLTDGASSVERPVSDAIIVLPKKANTRSIIGLYKTP